MDNDRVAEPAPTPLRPLRATLSQATRPSATLPSATLPSATLPSATPAPATPALVGLPSATPPPFGHSGATPLPLEINPSPSGRQRLADVTVRWTDLWLLVGFYAALVGTWYVFGTAVTSSDSLQDMDDSVAEWFVEQRTPTLDTASLIGSHLAETIVKVIATAVLVIAMKLAWKRWREPLMMAVPLILEASVFITVTMLVGRPRPDVERLDASPVDSSFPSGHVAAAAAYGALVVIVYWHTDNRWWRSLAVALTAAVVVTVAVARMYRGMHFLTDVVAGTLLGLAAVAASWWIIHRAVRRTDQLPAPQS